MKSVCLLFLLCSVLYVNCQSAEYIYDCRRQDDCMNGGTCMDDGACTCITGFEGYNCAKDTSLAACVDQAQCLNGGQCVIVNGADTCLCSYGHSGATCENENVNLQCTGSNMAIDLKFPDNFAGLVKIQPGADAPPNVAVPSECEFKTTSGAYTLDVQLSGTVDQTKCQKEYITTIIDAVTLETSYIGTFRVQYMPNLVTSVDQIYTLRCTNQGGAFTVYKEITNVDVNTDNLPSFEKNETYSPVLFEILDSNNTILNGDVTLYVGTPFKIAVRLEDDLVYKDLRFESCTANNTETVDMLTYELFKDGCPTTLGKRTTQLQTDHPTEPLLGKAMTVLAFKFINSKNIGLKCDITVCTTTEDAACKAPTDAECDGIRKTQDTPPTEAPAAPVENPNGAPADTVETPTDAPANRKKRAADDDESKTVSTVITVLGPQDYTSDTRKATPVDSTVEDCLARSEILAVLVVLASVVCILFIACFALACLMVRKRSSKNNLFEPTPCMNRDRFHIPRAHVNEAFREI